MHSWWDYNGRTIKSILSIGLGSVMFLALCFLIIISREHPPRSIYPSGPFDITIPIDAPGTSEIKANRPVIQGKLDERFAISWPHALRVGVPEQVIVRIAANDYEDLAKELAAFGGDVLKDHFKGYPKLEVTLVSDSSVDITPRHSNEQMIEKGRKHKEWSWMVFSKSTESN